MKAFRSFLSARFARRYLGLHLTIGFLVTVAAIWLFAAITEDVVRAEALTAFDRSVHDAVRAHASILGYATFGAVTELGSPTVIGLFGLLGAAVFAIRRRWLVLLVWLGAFAGGSILDAVLKLLVHRPRPDTASDFLVRESFSFPSGHSMMSVVCYGMIAYALVVMRWQYGLHRALTITFCVLVVLAVGASRIYLGVHYFSDVMAGFIAGTIWLTVCISALELMRLRALAEAPPPA